MKGVNVYGGCVCVVFVGDVYGWRVIPCPSPALVLSFGSQYPLERGDCIAWMFSN
jgi:hypothetical protein